MARGALNLSIPGLAALADVSKGTIERLEKGEALKDSTVGKVQTALEKAGVLFIPANGDDVGVRLKKRRARKG
jgi:predicted transcriptional regulator